MTVPSTYYSLRIDGNWRTHKHQGSFRRALLASLTRAPFGFRRSSIERELNEGTTIICDRYAFSGIAFSAAKGLPYEWCRAPDVSLPAPDLTLFLDISPEKAKERGGYGEERYEKEEMQKKVREVFGKIGGEMQDGQGRWIKVNAGQAKEAVANAIWEEVSTVVRGLDDPVGRLWV